MIKYILIKICLKILDKFGVNYFLYPNENMQVVVNGVVDQVEAKFKKEAGEFKRSQALRSCMNIDSKWTEREIALAIELAVQRDKK